jgi:hypothetical protein
LSPFSYPFHTITFYSTHVTIFTFIFPTLFPRTLTWRENGMTHLRLVLPSIKPYPLCYFCIPFLAGNTMTHLDFLLN